MPDSRKEMEVALLILETNEELLSQHADEKGELLFEKSTLSLISSIISSGLTLHNYIVEHNLFKDNNTIKKLLIDIENECEKLKISEENAKKLNIRDAMIRWSKLHGIILNLCIEIVVEGL